MTDSDRSLSEVPGLIEERRRYEGWLAALDARRESTPKHVFERVQADYQARLQRVAEQLASYRQAIDEERASVQARIALLEAEEQLQRDERAELDLRAHVGELSREDASGAFGAVDKQIERLVAEKSALGARVNELESLLDDGPRAKASPPENARANGSPAASAPDQAAAASVGEQKPAAPPPAAPVSPGGVATSQTVGPSGANGASFDELAFLSSVVAKTEPELREPPVRRESQLTIERRSSEPVLRSNDSGANVTGNSPIVLRPTGTIEQAKTLKCNECGAMNYPTEWYCERCGAELAAL
jgi:hypothetical protein